MEIVVDNLLASDNVSNGHKVPGSGVIIIHHLSIRRTGVIELCYNNRVQSKYDF